MNTRTLVRYIQLKSHLANFILYKPRSHFWNTVLTDLNFHKLLELFCNLFNKQNQVKITIVQILCDKYYGDIVKCLPSGYNAFRFETKRGLITKIRQISLHNVFHKIALYLIFIFYYPVMYNIVRKPLISKEKYSVIYEVCDKNLLI